MLEKIDANHLAMESGPSPKQSNSAGALPDSDADVSVQVDYASLIDEAMQTPQTGADAVQEAKELLLSGELESAAGFERAAEEIAIFGV